MIQEDRLVIPLSSLPFTFPCVLVHLMRHSIRLWESPSSFLSVFYYSHFPCLFIFSNLFSAYRPHFFSSYILHSHSHFALVLFKVRNLKWWRIKENKWMSRKLNTCSALPMRAFLSSHSLLVHAAGRCLVAQIIHSVEFDFFLRTPVWTILHRWKKAYLFNVCVKGNILVKNNLVMSSRVGFWLDPVQKKTFIKI